MLLDCFGDGGFAVGAGGSSGPLPRRANLRTSRAAALAARAVAPRRSAAWLAQVSALRFSPRKSCLFPPRARRTRPVGAAAGHGKMLLSAGVALLRTQCVQLERGIRWGRTEDDGWSLLR